MDIWEAWRGNLTALNVKHFGFILILDGVKKKAGVVW